MQLLLDPLLFLLIISPLLLLGKKKEQWKKHFLWMFVLYFFLDSLITVLPLEVSSLRVLGLTMNWEGKIGSYLLALIFLLSYKRLDAKAFGFRMDQAEGSTTFANRSLIIVAILITVYGYLIGGFEASVENILFQITMPSVVEEIAYRGILLALLNQVFERNFRWGKTQFGVGLIITSLLFGLWHGLSIGDNFSLEMNWFAFILTGLIGFLLGFVRERTGSLLYPIILHILINLIPNIIGLIF